MTDKRLERPLWRGRRNVDALTIACIENAESIVRRLVPSVAHAFVVTQGSYQDGHGDINSAGTHDGGGVVDIRWCGHPVCLRALRLAGMFAWHRTSAQGPWVHHIHAGVIDHPLLAMGARKQQASYFARRNGLANNGADDGPRLAPIPSPVWPWPPKKVRPAAVRAIRKAIKAARATAGPALRRRLDRADAPMREVKKR
jgi:hypothetical protein